MDGVFVEFHIYQPDLQVLDLLIGERATAERFAPSFQDQLHGLVEVLDTLCHVDEHVGALDRPDVLGLLFVHPCGDQDVTPLKRLLVHRDLAIMDQLHDRRVHRFELDVEPVVAVRRLPLNRARTTRDRLAVYNDRRRCDDIHTLVALDTPGDDLQVKLPHAAYQVLPGLFVDRDLHGRIFLGHLTENLNQFREVLHVLCLDSDGHDRFGVVFQRLERGHINECRHGRTNDGVF